MIGKKIIPKNKKVLLIITEILFRSGSTTTTSTLSILNLSYGVDKQYSFDNIYCHFNHE